MIKSLIKITTYMSLSTIVNMSGQTSVSRHMPIHADVFRRRLPLIFRSLWTSFVSLFLYFPSLFLTRSHLIACQNRNENCFYADSKKNTKIWKNFGDSFVNFLFDVNFIFKSTLMCCLCYYRNWLSVIRGVTWFTWGAHLRWLIYRILCVTPCMILAIWNKLVVLKLKVVFPLLSQRTFRQSVSVLVNMKAVCGVRAKTWYIYFYAC